MRHYSQSFAIILASLTAFPAAATPTDALINNTLSLPAELNKAMIVMRCYSGYCRAKRAALAVYSRCRRCRPRSANLLYGVYVPQTRGQ